MAHCPRCRSEYEEGFEQCPDCQVALIDPEVAAEPIPWQDLVTVAAFDNAAAAAVCAHRLEAEGIETAVNDAEILTMDPLLATAVGGIKVQVRKSDAPNALELLRQRPGPPAGEEPTARVCHHCGSSSTYREKLSTKAAFLSMLFIGFPLLLRSKKWKCTKCCRRFL